MASKKSANPLMSLASDRKDNGTVMLRRSAIEEALEQAGMSLPGVLSALARIATTGEKIVTKTIRKSGLVVQEEITVTNDPELQLKAIEAIQKIAATSSGNFTRRVRTTIDEVS